MTLGLAGQLQARDYGDAGCGLGSQLFHDNTKTDQVLASTTNGTTGTQWFGISSGTSNCVDSATVKSEAKVQLFIEANRLAIAKDISRGQGETLSTLAELLNCQDGSIGPVLQKNYDAIFPNRDTSAAKMSEAIRSTLRNSNLQCNYLG